MIIQIWHGKQLTLKKGAYNNTSYIEVPALNGNKLFGNALKNGNLLSIDYYRPYINFNNEFQTDVQRTIYVSVDPMTYSILV